MKLSELQKETIDRMIETAQPLIRLPGGFWTTNGTPMQEGNQNGAPVWWVGSTPCERWNGSAGSRG